MNDFTYELIYIIEAMTNIGFKIAVIYLIARYIEIRRLKA